MSYGQGLGIGIFLSLVSSVIAGAFQFIYVKFIDTEFNEKLMDTIVEKWEAQGMTDQQIDAARGFTEVFMNPVTGFFLGILIGIFIAFIASLIISAITKNANPQAEA